ncbi:hypothetical protein D5R81_17560 [Parashewanella spongiae]|uniref:Uncharacterized protein n=1 Tax=Parashewanella spongiae TaxID=342950 RepID=A0A3A6TNZ1_9GAMM|nr:hypothetical protein [Parashewanella spongiae]MCL1079874.1 hypothetical protein [Parashewanella spongiae]RJY06656.1 hypothetical protein D5R81_17560 [Parashewanella spongiae]
MAAQNTAKANVNGFYFQADNLAKIITANSETEAKQMGIFRSIRDLLLQKRVEQKTIDKIVSELRENDPSSTTIMQRIKRFQDLKSMTTINDQSLFSITTTPALDASRIVVVLRIDHYEVARGEIDKNSASHDVVTEYQSSGDLADTLLQNTQADCCQYIEKVLTCCQQIQGKGVKESKKLIVAITQKSETPKQYSVMCEYEEKELYHAHDLSEQEASQFIRLEAALKAEHSIASKQEEYLDEEYFLNAIKYMTEEGSPTRTALMDESDGSFNSTKFVSCSPCPDKDGFYEIQFKSHFDGKAVLYEIKYPFPLPFHVDKSNEVGSKASKVGAGCIGRGHSNVARLSELKSLLSNAKPYVSIREFLVQFKGTYRDTALFETVKPALMDLDKKTGGKGQCFMDVVTMRMLHGIKIQQTSVAELSQETSMLPKLTGEPPKVRPDNKM